MHNFFIRIITASILLIVGLILYLYAPSYVISLALITLACYVLWFEYRPLYKPAYVTSYSALILIISGFTALLCLNRWSQNGLALTFIFAILTDTGGYIFGTLFGKHYIAPTISPKKTWEGFVGSCICTILGVSIWLYDLWFSDVPNILLAYISIGFGCAFAGLLGDLCISQLKRNAGVKDTGILLPGHGGLLDRLDSILAIALFFMLL